MKSRIRQKIEVIHSGSPPPLLAAAAEDCVNDVMSGRVYRFGQIAKLLNCSHEFVRRQFTREPGVIKFRGIYFVPECVLQRHIRRSMIQ